LFRSANNNIGILALLRFGIVNIVALVFNHFSRIRVSAKSELLRRFKRAVQPPFIEAIHIQLDFLLNIRASSRDTNDDVFMVEADDLTKFEHTLSRIRGPHIRKHKVSDAPPLTL